jgi:S-methylmethionine-dependent homocysteine/selenocysteine methylase
MPEDEAEAYHREQIGTLAATDVDLVHAMIITYAAEAIGIARAAPPGTVTARAGGYWLTDDPFHSW